MNIQEIEAQIKRLLDEPVQRQDGYVFLRPNQYAFIMRKINEIEDEVKRLIAENERLTKRCDAAVVILNKVYNRVEPNGVDGGYPFGATTCIGLDVYNIVKEWRGLD